MWPSSSANVCWWKGQGVQEEASCSPSQTSIFFAWDNLLASYLCFKKIIWQIGDSKEVTSLLPISFLVKVSFLLMCWLKSALDKCPRCQGYLRVLGKLNGPFHPHHALVAHIK